ncbi:MAG: nitronate monooxygenase, partial [Ruminococcus sp.]|nr:nitronate monooxygenase [Ruminococcus sp.]
GNITAEVKKHSKKPLMVKLSPNVTDIAEIAKSAESSGADVISMINTLTGMRIDINSKRPIIRNNTGGLSGPAIFPVAVRMVWQVYNAVNIPIVGMGGISKWQDAVEMLMAGATAVQIGTALFNDPYAPLKINYGLKTFMEEKNISSISELTGSVIPW